MTKEFAIEQIFLSINGGKPSPNNSVLRVDIDAFLPSAVNYVMETAYNQNLQIEGDRDYNSEYYTAFNGVEIQRNENIPFIELTLGVVPLKASAGLRFVYDNCQHMYAPVPDSELANIQYYSDIATGMYWYRRTGNKLYLYGINPLIEQISYQAITRVEDLQMTDELPIQAGQETTCLQLMIQWFQNKFPINPLVNGNDINVKAIP